jgi:aryl-alcohol dehydrogenase-like predicted oxidoreductase
MTSTRQRKSKRTGLKIRLALGTVQFGIPYGIANRTGQVTRSEARAMLQLAAASCIDTLDTAVAYGESETRLGEAGVRDFKVVTKLSAEPDGCADVGRWVQDQVSASLARLGVSQLYGLLLHRSERLLNQNGPALYRALQSLKDSGRVQKLGVSIYSPSELDAIIQRFPIDLVQAPFNLVDRRLHTSGWLRKLEDDGVEIHTRSAFLQGLLLVPQADLPAKFKPWSALWEKWHKWLASHNTSAVEASLAFPLAFPEIDRVVVGADDAAQLAEIIAAAACGQRDDWPELHCEAEDLINPSSWADL